MANGSSFVTNYIFDPKLANDTAGVWDEFIWASGVGYLTPTRTIVADTGFNWQRIQYTGGAGDSGDSIYATSNGPLYYYFLDFGTGYIDPATFSLSVKGSSTDFSWYLHIYSYAAAGGGGVLDTVSQLFNVAAGAATVSVTLPGPAATGGRVAVGIQALATSDACVCDVQFGKPIVSMTDSAATWFSGDSTGAKWLGTANASHSVQSIVTDHTDRVLTLCAGNSLSWGYGSTRGTGDYPTVLKSLLSWPADTAIPYATGDSLANMITTAPSEFDGLIDNTYLHRLCILWEGTNDMNGALTAADELANYHTYCDARRAAGYEHIAVMTVLPATIAQRGAGWEAKRTDFNALLRAGYSEFADYLIDVGANALIGTSDAPNSSTYYMDGLHLNDAGYAIVASMVATAIESLVPAAPVTLTYGGLNLNDGATYTLLGEEVELGERVKVWDEYRSFAGTVAQYNVSEANTIEMRFHLLVQGASNAALNTAIAAINAKIDAGAQDLVWNDGGGAVTYSCLHSPRIRPVRDQRAQILYQAFVDLVLYREP